MVAPDAETSLIVWVSCYDPADGTSRRCTWAGVTSRVVVTGLPTHFIAKAPRAFKLPVDAKVHEVPHDDNGFDLARVLKGVLLTVRALSSITSG